MEVLGAEVRTDNFESLFRAQYKRIYRVIRRITGEPGAAEELAAEVFLKLLRTPPVEQSGVDRWLSQAAVWTAIDHLRKRSRHVRDNANAIVQDAPPHPHGQLEVGEEQWRVRHVLQCLDREHAQALLLREEGYTYAEISQMLGKNPASIGTLLARAEAAFRKVWVRAYGER